MNCPQVQQYLDDFLVVELSDTEKSALDAHLRGCPMCAHEYRLAQETLASIRPSHTIHPSPELKERIMSQIVAMNEPICPVQTAKVLTIRRRMTLKVVAVAASLAIAAGLFQWFRLEHGAKPGAFGLLSQAMAAEESLFTGRGIMHLVNEILIKPITNPTLAQMRWFPIVSVEATGKVRVHQLTLPAAPGESLSLLDQAWYDPASRRFIRVLSEMKSGKPVFANSFDGEAVYSLEVGPDGALRVAGQPRAADFQPPRSPAEFLGIAAGLPGVHAEKDKDLFSEAGEVTLGDGSQARVVKSGFPQGGPAAAQDSCVLFTIRKDDNTIAEIEWKAEGESLLVVRRVQAKTVEKPAVPWNLAGLEIPGGGSGEKPTVGIRPDMVVADVSVRRMVEKADFETYIFKTPPSWAGERQITDVLDVASPPHRMFAISYRAKDKRHVVLVQSPSYNKMLGSKVKSGRLVYTSPNGFKVWSGPMDQWLADILLRSAQAAIKDAPAKNRTGYALESPRGTFPCLAVNGPMSDEELHGLIDSLVAAKEFSGK